MQEISLGMIPVAMCVWVFFMINVYFGHNTNCYSVVTEAMK
jgi:hypothetical protein